MTRTIVSSEFQENVGRLHLGLFDTKNRRRARPPQDSFVDTPVLFRRIRNHPDELPLGAWQT